MRYIFGEFVADLVMLNPRNYVLAGDIGYGVFDRLRAENPDHFINVGICEQSMVSMAAGMALQGLIPWVYTITPFLIERAFEQIKIDVAAQNANVMLAGYADYPEQGVTHAEIDAPKLMALLPEIRSFFPDTGETLFEALEEMCVDDGPAFISLKKAPQ